MLSTSLEFRNKVAQSSRVLVKATLTLADGTVVELTGDDIAAMSFSDAVSSASSFDVGAAVINRLDITLNNYDQRFSLYDFTGATIAPYVGVELDAIDPQTGEHGVEWLRKGVFGIEQPDSYGGTIGLSCLDNMRLLEVPYSEVATVYPATLGTIVRDICTACGLALLSSSFDNHSYNVATRPDDSAMSCLDMMSYAAQVSGNYARCDTYGRMSLKWYNTSAFEGEDWLDGDRFDGASPYASGDTADGGNFSDYSSGASADGGAFGIRAFAYVHAISSAAICTDDVVITGVRVKAQDQVKEDGSMGAEGETALSGSEGYVIAMAENPLVLYGKASAVAEQVAARVVGMRFRPFDASALGDPAVEAGDPVVVVDGRQNQYFSYLTSVSFKVGGYERFACGADTPSRNSAASYSALTKAFVQARKDVRREASSRETAIRLLADELADSSGLFMTQQPQQDGSTIYYMHDKPTLAQSQIVWKMTANAFGISTDGGRTYPYGLDASGMAILNRIYAIGIDAQYINAGTIALAKLTSSARETIDNAAKTATDYITINGSEIQIGSTATGRQILINVNGVQVGKPNQWHSLFDADSVDFYDDNNIKVISMEGDIQAGYPTPGIVMRAVANGSLTGDTAAIYITEDGYLVLAPSNNHVAIPHAVFYKDGVFSTGSA